MSNVREMLDSELILSCHCLQCSICLAEFASNMIYNWWCLSRLQSFTFLMCVQQIPRGSTTGWLGGVITISALHLKYRSSVSGTPIPILSDTHSHSLLLLLLNRDLGWGPWSFIPAKLDPGEGLVGTDVRLQEALEAPGVSMTLASVLFGKVNGRLRQMKKQQRKTTLWMERRQVGCGKFLNLRHLWLESHSINTNIQNSTLLILLIF